MRFLSVNECISWSIGQLIPLGEDQRPTLSISGMHTLKCKLPSSLYQIDYFSQLIEGSLHPRDRCLLWVTDWSVGINTDNWHLYYRLRQSYGDQRLIEEAPGHLFLNYEIADMVSFIKIGLIHGWDIHLLPSEGYGRVFISHDEWVQFDQTTLTEIEGIKKEMLSAGCILF